MKWGYPRGGVVICRNWLVGRQETELRLRIIMGTGAGTKRPSRWVVDISD